MVSFLPCFIEKFHFTSGKEKNGGQAGKINELTASLFDSMTHAKKYLILSCDTRMALATYECDNFD